MAGHTAIAAVSRSFQALLLDRLAVAADVTLAPPDISVDGIAGARVNLYLVHVSESAALKSQDVPGRSPPGGYGRPPLWLDLRYLLTTHGANETAGEADLNAQVLLGDAMRVLHDLGPQISSLRMLRAVAGRAVGDPVLDPSLVGEPERVRITLSPSPLDELTRLWSAFNDASFRRSALYEVGVVQIETAGPRSSPRPVETRRILAGVRRRPTILDAYVTPGPGNPQSDPRGERRARIGDQLTIEAEGLGTGRLYVRLGNLLPIRVPVPPDGVVRIALPDGEYDPDLDHPGPPRPIPPAQQLQPGPLPVALLAVQPVEGIEGGVGRGTPVSEDRQSASNLALLQLVPNVTSVLPESGGAATVLTIKGTRLWRADARVAQVAIGGAAIPIQPGPGLAAPTAAEVEVRVGDIAALLPVQAPGDPPYAVAVEVDGARSRAGFGFARVVE